LSAAPPFAGRRAALTDENQLMDQIIDQRDTAGAVVTDGLGRNVKQTIQVRDEPGIARHVAELDEVIALKVQEVRLVKRQQTLAGTVAAHLKAGIQERIARIQAIKAKVKANLAARATMLKDLHAERKNKHPDKARIGRLTRHIQGIEAENVALAGETTTLGEGGQLDSTRKGLAVFQEQLTGSDGVAPLLDRLPNTLTVLGLDTADVQKDREAWTGTVAPPVDLARPRQAARPTPQRRSTHCSRNS